MRFLFIGLALAAGWSGAALAIDTGGTVRYGDQPVPGATVRVSRGEQRFATTTDESGRWTFDLSEGLWRVEVEMFGFEPLAREIAVPAHPSVLEFSLALKPPASRPEPPGAGQGNGFHSVVIEESPEAEAQDAAPPAAAVAEPLEPHEATEAFLVNGSVTRGLEAPVQEDAAIEAGRDVLRAAAAAQAAQSGMGGLSPASSAAAAAGRKAAARKPPSPKASAKSAAKGGTKGALRGTGRKSGGATASRFGNRRSRKLATLQASAWYSLRNSALDARPFSLTGQTVAKPDYEQNRMGFALGGPLHIPKLLTADRSFFYVSYHAGVSRQPYSAVATLPSPLERAGDFSQSATRIPVTVHDPTNRQPLPGNLLPVSRVHPAARGLLDYIPFPNQPGRLQNYQLVTSVPQNTHNLSLRFNQGLSRRDRLSLSSGMQRKAGENAQVFGFLDGTGGRGYNTDLAWNHTFSRKLIHSLKLNINRNRSEVLPFFSSGRDVARELGIAGTSRDPVNFGPPNLHFTNFGGLSDASPVLRRDQNVALTDSLTWVRKTHNFSFGGEYRRLQLNSRTDQNGRGTFSFSGLLTSGFDADGDPLPGTGFDFADFLLGLPQSSSVRFGANNTYFRGTSYAAFAQDDWRMRKNFSLTYGLRYEFSSPLHEKQGHMANLDIAPGFTGVAVVTPGAAGPYSGVFPRALIDPDRNNLSPRLGIAWRPSRPRHFQVRAGYGVYYNNSVYNQFATRLASQPPFANTATLSTSISRPLTIDNGFATAPTQRITNTFAVDRGYRVGYAQTWNFSIQQELPGGLALELGYLGTKGTRLDIQRLPNRAPPGSPLTSEQRRLIGNAVGFTYDSSEGNSILHSAQARVTRRFRKGVSYNALYTFSKSIDNVSTFGGGGNTVAQNDKDLRAERGLSSFHQSHVLNTQFVLTSPVGGSAALIPAAGWTARLLEDWTLAGGFTARSGTPITARVLGNRADSSGTGVVGNGRAEATGQPVNAGGGFFNLQAFGVPPPGRLGNAGRNTIIGPAFFALNASFGRSFKLGDRHRLECRIESNNLTNFVTFTNLNAVVNSLNYGLPVSAAAMRTVSAMMRFRW